MEKYKILSQIGKGSFGQVYKAKRCIDGETVAFKVIRKSGRSVEELTSLKREYEIQRYLCHPNIIRLLDSFETDNEIVVVTEYADKQLYEILLNAGQLSEERVQVIVCDLVSALHYLHSNMILHRDLKPQNVLIDANGISKLCDFGFARCINSAIPVLTSIKGTPLYMAPELIEEHPYNYNVDLWSLGCIAYELITGAPPFPTSSIVKLINLIRHETIKWPNYISPNCKNFLQGLLQKDPYQRLTWPNLLNHPFVKNRILIVENTSYPVQNIPFNNQMYMNYLINQNNQFQGEFNYKYLDQARKLAEKGAYISNEQYYKTIQDFSHCSETYCDIRSRNVDFIPAVNNLDNYILRGSNNSDFNSDNSMPNVHNSNISKNTLSSVNPSNNSNVSNNTDRLQLLKESTNDTKLKHKISTLNSWKSNEKDPIIENEEWVVFIQKSIEEIMEGEIESLLQENCVTIFISPLKNASVNCRVIEYISCLLSLPFVLTIKEDNIEKIQNVYLNLNVVTYLVSAVKTLITDFDSNDTNTSKSLTTNESVFMISTDKLQPLEYCVLLLCRLLYIKDEFVNQFCDALTDTNDVKIFHNLFKLEKRKPRIVSDMVAIFIKILQLKVGYSNIVEQSLNKYPQQDLINLLKKLLSHNQSIIRSRTCTLIRLMAKIKMPILEQIWGLPLRSLLEALINDFDISVRNVAEDTLTEMRQMDYYNQEIEAG